MKHPLTTTNTTLSTPPSGRRFCKLLTPGVNLIRLTKVNKTVQLSENQYPFVHVSATIQAINHHFVNRHTTKRQQMFWFINQGNTARQHSSTKDNQGHNRGIGCNMHSASFSLLRFFWRGKRNEGQLSSDPMLKHGMSNARSPKAFIFVL